MLCCARLRNANARASSRRLGVNGPRRPLRSIARATLTTEDLCRLVGLTPGEAAAALSACPALAGAQAQDPGRDPDVAGLVESNAGLLLRGNGSGSGAGFRIHEVAALVRRRPGLLLEPRLGEWLDFLTGYGLSGQEVWKVLAYGSSSSSSSSGAGDGSSSSSGGGPGGSSISISSFDGLSAGGNVTSGLVGAPGASPYAAGAAIVWLKSWGWTDADVTSRLLPCYPHVLAGGVEPLQAAVDSLREQSFDDDAIRRLVLTFPALLAPPLSAPLLALLGRIRTSAHNKYVVSGSYHV
ncbi:hypothetical protein CHLRE_08g382575v5 [Chlamydomonas reinhardtii]|uniref:Uncharacterized protein n=1 Tax=Chlamydomonas reinhardtii TaxID=3055 RepID=A0A2K3DI65_CHLRE|nr:uncharacterized protein CHLRE_08g382575v5 [Chlamydomonas reinhardtii]PNW80212.1 hypothetical protein CHLRE_08g382575v5 [Chlamydomonas reinhardtii]